MCDVISYQSVCKSLLSGIFARPSKKTWPNPDRYSEKAQKISCVNLFRISRHIFHWTDNSVRWCLAEIVRTKEASIRTVRLSSRTQAIKHYDGQFVDRQTLFSGVRTYAGTAAVFVDIFRRLPIHGFSSLCARAQKRDDRKLLRQRKWMFFRLQRQLEHAAGDSLFFVLYSLFWMSYQSRMWGKDKIWRLKKRSECQ